MKYFVIFIALTFVGCDMLAPDVSKAQTEKQQLEEMKKQTIALEAIAKAAKNG